LHFSPDLRVLQPGAILRRLLFETELCWGPENKEQAHVREGWGCPNPVAGLEMPQEAAVERKRVGQEPAGKFRQQGAGV
jgi:hypothetical protein